eukprot:UN28407
MFVAPLPERKFMASNPKFIEERRHDLERFLNRIEEIPCFHAAKALLIFLTCPESTFSSKCKSVEGELDIATAEKLRKFNKKCNTIKLPTDLDFEIQRHKNEFSVRKTELEEILNRSLALLRLHEKSQNAIIALNSSLETLMESRRGFAP